MSSERDLAADFRALADAVLDRVDPMIRRLDGERAMSAGASPAAEWQGCTWCPLCALAALMRGERHDLLTLVSSELDVVLAALREILRDHGDRPHAPSATGRTETAPADPTDAAPTDPSPSDSHPAGPATDARPGPSGPSRAYVPIAVTVKDGRP